MFNKLTKQKAEQIRAQGLTKRRFRQAEHAAQVCGEIKRYRAQGMGWRRIAAILNLGGISAPRGGVWHPHTARRISRLMGSKEAYVASEGRSIERVT